MYVGPHLTITAEGDGETLRIAGEVDLTNVGEVTRAFDSAVACVQAEVLVDLSRLTFIDCAGIRALVAAHESLHARRGRMVIAGCQPIVFRLIRLLGASEYLNLSVPGARCGDDEQTVT